MARPRVGTGGGLTEAAWQAQVIGLARFYGWRIYHPPDNRPNARGRVQAVEPGFPDLVMVRGLELVVAELKTDAGRVGPGQDEWLAAFRAIGEEVAYLTGEAGGARPDVAVDAYLWRPRDFDAVQARLARGRRIIPAGFAP